MVNWDNEAQRKRITRQRNRLLLEIKSFGVVNLNQEELAKRDQLKKELDELETKYFQSGREGVRKYLAPKESNILVNNWLKGKLVGKNAVIDTKYISRASTTAERVAVHRYRRGLTLSREQRKIIKYLRLTKSRYDFDKFTWKR